MLKGCDILCFAPTDWWGRNPSCTVHIMKRFAAHNKILYINPFSSDLLGGQKKGLSKRITRKLKSTFKFVRKVQSNLYVLSPLFFPVQHKAFANRLNNRVLSLQIRLMCKALNMPRPILWVENPRAADLLDCFGAKVVVYHVSDLFTKCRYTADKAMLNQREAHIFHRSDVVICVSKTLYDLKAADHTNVHYLPHGVDFHLFNQAAQRHELYEGLVDVPKPIVGYFGTLTSSNDIDLLQFCASRLTDMSFVFAGQITAGDYSELAKLPNVHFLGKVPYEKIPELCAGFDVCILPWKMSEWIYHCNPLKTMEYMASGKPIVSVPIQEMVDTYSDVVSIAHDKEAFCHAIQWELQNDTMERANRRIEIAKAHSWDHHLDRLSGIIKDAIAAKDITRPCDSELGVCSG